MNKTAIKNFAIWARKKLIADITYKAGLLGITEKGIGNPLPQSTKDVQFFDIGAMEPYSIKNVEIEQRKHLVDIIQQKEKQSDYKTAYNSVIEEVAYTWFNRLIAVRFMEVNDYLPSRIRVLSSESSSKIEPDLVTSPFDADLDYTPYEKDRIIQLKNDNKLDELFRMLFIKQCNALNTILPKLFEKTNDYTELLMNVSFIDKDGVVYRLVQDITEDDFNMEKEGQVEIIGWLYQYYNTEPKDETFALLKKNVKITKERIPAATQLFTPDWIVRYMVENSLGRFWIEGHPNDELKAKWKYYLDEAEQEPEVQAHMYEIREEYKNIKPEDIKVIDPCMGSGHILVYAFDVLMQVYESYGYSQRDAAKSILENNLFGLDIDNRAYQLAYFAVMMKARQYNRRILDGNSTCHVYEIMESNEINVSQLNYFGFGMNEQGRNTALSQMEYLLNAMRDAKEYGSLLKIGELNWELLCEFTDKMNINGQLTFDTIDLEGIQKRLQHLVTVAAIMASKYDVVVTNPPYMGSSGMGVALSEFIKDNYSSGNNDLYSCFIERALELLRKNGFTGLMTSYTWMFLTSYTLIRENIIRDTAIYSLVQPEYHAFFQEAFVPICTFVLRKTSVNYKGKYIRLENFPGAEQQKIKTLEAISNNECDYLFITSQKEFRKIPNYPIAYWLNPKSIDVFSIGKSLALESEVITKGIFTGDNNQFIRLWFEVKSDDIGAHKWNKYCKGGAFRRWYGNNDYVVLWENGKGKLSKFSKSGLGASKHFGKRCIVWSKITTSLISFRENPIDVFFDDASPAIIFSGEIDEYILGLLNSKPIQYFLNLLSPTINNQIGDIRKIPILRNISISDTINQLVRENVLIAKADYDSSENSIDFMNHPLLNMESSYIEECVKKWLGQKNKWINLMQENEEKINDIFIRLYSLEAEITPNVENEYISITKTNEKEIIQSFISYSVGCMFGRYSVDTVGIAYAGGLWDKSKYKTFIPDSDNIIPITDEEYFDDDIVGLFCSFLKMTFGEATLDKNLDYIVRVLGNKGTTTREAIRNYFLKDFYKDHINFYTARGAGKRPIYWLFDSGNENGFKALIYMHRYNEDTIGNLRIDYLHRMQRVYESEIARMQDTIDNSNNAREVAAATKRKEKLTRQLKETKDYDEKIAHLALARIPIDLDDGVKVNYDKVQTGTDGKKLDVLAKI